jgi:hypothetical protein
MRAVETIPAAIEPKGKTGPLQDKGNYGRMIGCAAEIDDHLNRGRNMDTRTPASECRFVA